jgi:hypothetical protein
LKDRVAARHPVDFTKLGLVGAPEEHRRVMAMLRYLRGTA